MLSAAEIWQPEKIAELSWMFAGDAAVDKETKVIVSLRDQLPQHLGAMKGITSCKSSFRNDAKLLELVEQVLALQEKIEDRPALKRAVPDSRLHIANCQLPFTCLFCCCLSHLNAAIHRMSSPLAMIQLSDLRRSSTS